jgi:hypothetical protein
MVPKKMHADYIVKLRPQAAPRHPDLSLDVEYEAAEDEGRGLWVLRPHLRTDYWLPREDVQILGLSLRR